jgi:hypothetical protein
MTEENVLKNRKSNEIFLDNKENLTSNINYEKVIGEEKKVIEEEKIDFKKNGIFNLNQKKKQLLGY